MGSIVSQIQTEFKDFLDFLVEHDLVLDTNALELEKWGNKSRLIWAGASGLTYLFSDYSSIEQYKETIKRRDFSLCLIDGSLIQIHYVITDNEISYHRLCFIPCPFKYEAAEWEDLALFEIPEMMSHQDLIDNVYLTTPIRFDFDVKFSDDKHANSHISLNKQTCRIPAYGPISLGHFFRFVFRYFYENQVNFDALSLIVGPRLYKRTLEHPSPHEIHFESAIGY